MAKKLSKVNTTVWQESYLEFVLNCNIYTENITVLSVTQRNKWKMFHSPLFVAFLLGPEPPNDLNLDFPWYNEK